MWWNVVLDKKDNSGSIGEDEVEKEEFWPEAKKP